MPTLIREDTAGMTPPLAAILIVVCLAVVGFALWFAWRRHAVRQLLWTLQTLSSGMPRGVVAWDARSRVMLWSDGAESLFGLLRADVLGQPLPARLAALKRVAPPLRRHPMMLQRADGGGLKAAVTVLAAPGKPGMRIAAIEDLTSLRSEAEWAEASRVQRDALIREVHHRIKNSLQGVAGLLRQHLSDKPLLRPLLEAASAQVFAIAAVHGLQGESRDGAINLRMLVTRVAASVSGIMHVPIIMSERCASLDVFIVNEEESVPVAMVLNELVMNAAKHRVHAGAGLALNIDAVQRDGGVDLHIRNPGFLPPDFDLSAGQNLGNGLSLARSLLPRRGAHIAMVEEGDRVLTSMTLLAPDVLSPQPLLLVEGG